MLTYRTNLSKEEVGISSIAAYIHQDCCQDLKDGFVRRSSDTSVQSVREEHLFFDRPEDRIWPRVPDVSYDCHEKLLVCRPQNKVVKTC